MSIRIKNNRTKHYLFPIVNTFGSTFIKELSNLTNYAGGYIVTHSILSVNISDYLWYKSKQIELEEIKEKPYLFIVFDVRGCYNENKDVYINAEEGIKRFKLFLSYVRKNKHYVEDYWFGSYQHCIVFKVDYVNSYKQFFFGNYSKMYSTEDLKNFKLTKKTVVQGKEYLTHEYAVLTKDTKVGSVYLKKVIYEKFGVDDIPDNPKEYDIPWFIEDEILNHNYIPTDRKTLLKEYKSNAQILQS